MKEEEIVGMKLVQSHTAALEGQLEERTRELERMTKKCANADEAQERIQRLRAKMEVLIKDKEQATVAQGEGVATMERLQRMQFQSKLELQHANDKLRSQVRPHKKT